MSRKLKENLYRVLDRVGLAAAKTARRSDTITTVVVTKSVDEKLIKKLMDLGHVDFGENHVQQLTDRADRLGFRTTASANNEAPAESDAAKPRWHMIGHLQRNKVKPLLPRIRWLHSLDSLRLAEEINNQAAKTGQIVEAFLQVNASGEKSKSGVAVGAATHLIEQVQTLSHLQIIGLMTMAPLVDDAEKARPVFARTRELFEEIAGERLAGPGFKHLSMGMSQDFEVAIEEGADVIRVGTAIFEGI
ncbi:MAG: YggS family pyridoxal phosphate-dependent enzyme [Phycisphaerae bacterium]|nr:YggS family pyridoxal phosphate-dependent enzyme [Phycisphaerae bacterium]